MYDLRTAISGKIEKRLKLKLPNHKTKIVCTIGPASRSEAVLKDMIRSGMNVARLNLSHGSLEDHRQDILKIRSAAKELDRMVAILIDLPGLKIRIGQLPREPLILKRGDEITLTTKPVAGKSFIPVEYKKLPQSVSKGKIIYLNDGFIQLRVEEVKVDRVRCKVVLGGHLLSHQGINLPGARITGDAVTERDYGYVDFGFKEGVSIFGISFIEKAEDILKLKAFAKRRGKSIRVVAKIERAEAVKNIDSIMAAADAIMVARGDLGVQIPLENVPAVQKKIIYKANLMGRPVITATQMLESMTQNVRPTRAEVADVANAIMDGTDAVMLSEETAIGSYPVETIKIMSRIAVAAEQQFSTTRGSSGLEEQFRSHIGQKEIEVEDVVSLAVIEAGRTLNAPLIITPTHTGNTPRRISRFKPDSWILSFGSDKETYQFLAFSYGVYPFLFKNNLKGWHEVILRFIKDSRFTKKGDRVILTEGITPGQMGGTDSLRIIRVT
jgi:pyruvate kinase